MLRSPVFLAQEVGRSLDGSQVLLRALPEKSQGEAVTTLCLVLDEMVIGPAFLKDRFTAHYSR